MSMSINLKELKLIDVKIINGQRFDYVFAPVLDRTPMYYIAIKVFNDCCNDRAEEIAVYSIQNGNRNFLFCSEVPFNEEISQLTLSGIFGEFWS